MTTELAKTIKPRKLNNAKVRQKLLKALKAEGDAVKKEYEKTVATWNDPPKFEVLTDISGNDATVLVGPVGTDIQVNKFVWTDDGTKPHPIVAKNAPVLVFQSGYSPKTLPGKIASYPAGHFGEFVHTKRVNHPGTKPRNFTKTIIAKRRKPFAKAVNDASKLEYT